jgi:SAM-dependent methyltransferase
MQEAILYKREEAIQEHAGRIQESPRTYVEAFDSKVENYMAALGDIETQCLRPDVDKEKMLKEITLLNDSMLHACDLFEQEVKDPLAVKQAQVYFREKTHPILSKSYLINRTRTWPQGHQGDFMTLELAYKNIPMSAGIGSYLDKYMLSTTLGVGVRERIAKMRGLLKEELTSRKNPRVLDVACGSCREVFELASEIKTAEAKFTCIDLDSAALDFALDRFAYAGLSEEHAAVIQYNALRMFDEETARSEFGMHDVIYSIGFFDYLPDDFLTKLLSSLYLLLNPGGKLIASFKDADRYRPQLFRWLVDWDGFLQRTEKDFERVLRDANIPSSALEMARVDSGSIVFYIATKG